MANTPVQLVTPVSPRRWIKHSHSSHGDLVTCERKYWFRKVAGVEAEPTKAMRKGLFIHQLLGGWWETGSFQSAIDVFAKQWAVDHMDVDDESGELGVAPYPDWVGDCLWLADRYAAFYGPHREDWEIVGVEVPWQVRLPGRYAWMVGRFDMVVRDRMGRLWLVEFKSMSGWDTLEEYTWSPQVSLYYWAGQELGMEPYGVLLDALYTYRWKNPRPLEDSFQRRWLDRNPAHITAALAEAEAGMVRARELQRGAFPLRNVDRHCGWCSYREPCRNELAFGSEFPLEWTEDE